jgi:hypothetical protein
VKSCYNGKCETNQVLGDSGIFNPVDVDLQLVTSRILSDSRTLVLRLNPLSTFAHPVALPDLFRKLSEVDSGFSFPGRKIQMAKAKIEVKCANPQCGKVFSTTNLNKTCCNSSCYKVACESSTDSEDRFRFNSVSKVTTGTIGATHELVVSADLLKRGFGVFRALSPSCPCDLILMIDGALFRLEVRTGRRTVMSDRLQFPFSGKDVGRADILAVVEENWNITYYDKKQEVIENFYKMAKRGKKSI